jgi:hypothetical protein
LMMSWSSRTRTVSPGSPATLDVIDRRVRRVAKYHHVAAAVR